MDCVMDYVVSLSLLRRRARERIVLYRLGIEEKGFAQCGIG